MVCLCAQVAEIFDFWDHTLQTGKDIEYSLVIVVLIVGSAFGLAHVLAVATPTVSLMSCLLPAFDGSGILAPRAVQTIGYSPPLPLRI